MISFCIKRWKPEWFDALCIQCTMRISPSTGFTSTNSRFESSITQSSSHSSHSVSIIQSTMRTSLSTGFTSINFRFESLTHHLHVIPMSHSRILDNCFYINGVHFNQLPVWVINHPVIKSFKSFSLNHPVYDEDFTFYRVHFNQLPVWVIDSSSSCHPNVSLKNPGQLFFISTGFISINSRFESSITLFSSKCFTQESWKIVFIHWHLFWTPCLSHQPSSSHHNVSLIKSWKKKKIYPWKLIFGPVKQLPFYSTFI